MGLFDFVTDIVGDVVGDIVDGVTDTVGDVVGGIVDGVTDTVGDVVGGIVGGVTDTVGDVVGGIVGGVTDTVGDLVGGFVDGVTDIVGDVTGGVEDMLDNIDDLDDNLIDNDFSANSLDQPDALSDEILNNEAIEDHSIKSSFIPTAGAMAVGVAGVLGAQKAYSALHNIKSGNSRQNRGHNINPTNTVNGGRVDRTLQNKQSIISQQNRSCNVNPINNVNNARDNRATIPVKKNQPIAKEKVTPAKSLLISLKKLRSEEERKIKEISEKGSSLLASATDTLLSSSKKNRFWGVAKSLAGKTKEEKLEDVQKEFDERKARLFDQAFTPDDPADIWEMFMLLCDINNQPGLGEKELTACQHLLWRITEICEMRFRRDPDKLEMISLTKNKYFLGE